MNDADKHTTHSQIVTRLKRADGHLRHVIEMIEAGRPCTEIAQQLHAVERAIVNAKRRLIHDHMDHCLGRDGEGRGATPEDLADFRQIAKYL